MSFDDSATTEFMPQGPKVKFINDRGEEFSQLYTEGHPTSVDYSSLMAVDRHGKTRPIQVDDEGFPLAVFDNYDEFLEGLSYRADTDGNILRNDYGIPIRPVVYAERPKEEPKPQTPVQPQQKPKEEPASDPVKPWLIAGIVALALAVVGLVITMLVWNSNGDTGSDDVAVTPPAQEQRDPETIVETVTETETETETVTRTPRPETETETVTEDPETVTETVTEQAPPGNGGGNGGREPTEPDDGDFRFPWEN